MVRLELLVELGLELDLPFPELHLQMASSYELVRREWLQTSAKKKAKSAKGRRRGPLSPSPSPSLPFPHLRDIIVSSSQDPTDSFLVPCSRGQNYERD